MRQIQCSIVQCARKGSTMHKFCAANVNKSCDLSLGLTCILHSEATDGDGDFARIIDSAFILLLVQFHRNHLDLLLLFGNGTN